MKGMIVLLGMLAAGTASAQLNGTYRVNVNIENTFGRDWNNIGTAIAGWICTSSSEVVYKERHKDYKGNEQEIPRAHKSTFGTTLLRNPQIDMTFDADLAATSNTKVIVTENCHFDPTVVNAGIDVVEDIINGKKKNKNATQLPRAQEGSAFLRWECDVNQPLPRVTGQPLSTECKSTNVNFPFSVQDAIAAVVKDKKIRATFTLDKKEEKFTKNFCGDNRRDRVIIHLGGGIGGHLQEHHFVFDVEIKNETTGETHKFPISTYDPNHNSGTLNDDIAYCGSPGKRDKISVKVSARTDHYVFGNKKYYGLNGSEQVSFDLATGGGDRSKDITLYRKSAFGNQKEKYDSNISVTVIDPAAGTTAHAAAPALASTH